MREATGTNLLERYLGALRPLLPRKTGADILREISDEILSQMEEAADSLGRPLSEDEQAEILKKYGHPVAVAARYGYARTLIGPELFPFYALTLKISIIGALVIKTMIILASLMLNKAPGQDWMPALLQIPGVLVPVFAWITAVFAAFQFCQPFVHNKLRPKWDPRSLPDTSRYGFVPRTQSAAGVIFGIVGLVWWQLIPSTPFLVLGPAAFMFRLGPVWSALHWPVLVLIMIGTLKSAIDFVKPQRTVLRTRVVLLLHAVELVVLCVALWAGNWVEVAPSLANIGHYSASADALNRALIGGCYIALLIRAVQFVFQCIRHWRESSPEPRLRAASVIRH